MDKQTMDGVASLDFPFSGIEFLKLHDLTLGDYCDYRRAGIISASAPLEGREGQFSSSHLSLDSARFHALQVVEVSVELEIFDEFIDFIFPIFNTHSPGFWTGMYIDQEGPFGDEDEKKLFVFAREFKLSIDSFWNRWDRSGLASVSMYGTE